MRISDWSSDVCSSDLGFEQAQRIKAAADREATVIKAEADRAADILPGQGEGIRTEILNKAYGQDTEFFNFYRTMQDYTAALDSESTYMVLSADSEILRCFQEELGRASYRESGYDDVW